MGEMLEQATPPLVIDLGCGNGRDLIFFYRHGFEVFGVDASAKGLKRIAESFPELANRLRELDFSSEGDFASYLESIPKSRSRVFYSRFVLHSLHERVWESHIVLVGAAMQPGDRFFVEFRTDLDDALPKATPQHFRKGLRSTEVFETAIMSGLHCDYFVEGFGYAKYKTDNAHVARLVFSVSNGHSS